VTEENLPAEGDRASVPPTDEGADEAIDEADEESFPASDSPSSWAGPAGDPG
jgi:hypothetical protein